MKQCALDIFSSITKTEKENRKKVIQNPTNKIFGRSSFL